MDEDYKNFVERMGSFEDDFDDFFGVSDTVLQHYGVLGMHWGQRKSKVLAISRNNAVTAMRYNADHHGGAASKKLRRLAARLDKVPVNELSKKQIKNGEKEASKILGEHGRGYLDSKSISRGMKFMADTYGPINGRPLISKELDNFVYPNKGGK